jgi:hypothetical protein
LSLDYQDESESDLSMSPVQSKVLGPVVLAAILAFFGPAERSDAASVSISAAADTTLQEAFPANNYGGGASFTSGGRRRGGTTRGLFRFDVAGSVPVGATINAVTLTLNVTATPDGGVNSIFDLHRLTASWGEGNNTGLGGAPADVNETTWTHRFAGGAPWGMPGGDFVGTVSGSRSIAGNGSYTFASTANLVSDVQAWLNNPAGNFGWILTSQSEDTAATIRRFASRESGAAGPQLAITFTPVPEPGTWAILLVGSVGFFWSIRRRAIRR